MAQTSTSGKLTIRPTAGYLRNTIQRPDTLGRYPLRTTLDTPRERIKRSR